MNVIQSERSVLVLPLAVRVLANQDLLVKSVQSVQLDTVDRIARNVPVIQEARCRVVNVNRIVSARYENRTDQFLLAMNFIHLNAT